jgi:hypothetical protein
MPIHGDDRFVEISQTCFPDWVVEDQFFFSNRSPVPCRVLLPLEKFQSNMVASVGWWKERTLTVVCCRWLGIRPTLASLAGKNKRGEATKLETKTGQQ